MDLLYGKKVEKSIHQGERVCYIEYILTAAARKTQK
jgi:hypothetical protein